MSTHSPAVLNLHAALIARAQVRRKKQREQTDAIVAHLLTERGRHRNARTWESENRRWMHTGGHHG